MALETGAPSPAEKSADTSIASRVFGVVPGVLLTTAIAATGTTMHVLPWLSIFSPMILSIFFGIAFHNLAGTSDIAKDGVRFCLRRILRGAIILLGLQLTFTQVVEVGGIGISIIAASLVATFLFTTWLGHVLGVDRKLTQLIAAGTSICGASAVIATNTVTDAPEEDVAYGVACVTVFGSLAMFLYPLLPAYLNLDPNHFGLWTGASIHEIAQVVAAAFQDGQVAGEFGTIAKLSRVMMLAPLVIALGWIVSRRASGGAKENRAKAPLPWFVFGFIALIAVNSLVTMPDIVKSYAPPITAFLLSIALAAMGLETDLRKLRAKGLLPLLVGAAAWIFIGGFSLALIKLFL